MLWKLAAASHEVVATVTYPRNNNSTTTTWTVNVTACVPDPYALLIGKVNISHRNSTFNVTCTNCQLTNCIANIPWGEQVVVLHQPAFVMLPVDLSEPWYDDHSVQVWRELTSALSRPRRFVGLLIAGIMALVTLIATSTAAAVALTQTVQTAHFVNNLSKNVSTALGTQEAIDNKVEEKLNALYDTVQYMGEEIQALKLRTRLDCHASYKWICVTSTKYNQSTHPWDKIKRHLMGIWNHANESLDLLALHGEIQGLQSAEPLRFDAAQTASTFLHQLLGILPSPSDIQHLAITIAIVGTGVIIILCILPCLIRRGAAAVLALQTGMHEIKLRNKP